MLWTSVRSDLVCWLYALFLTNEFQIVLLYSDLPCSYYLARNWPLFFNRDSSYKVCMVLLLLHNVPSSQRSHWGFLRGVTLSTYMSRGGKKHLGGIDDVWWWQASSHHCRCEEVADEIEEQGDILRYLAAVLTIMTSSTPLTSRLQWDCMHMGCHTIHPTNKTSLMLLWRYRQWRARGQTHGHFVISVIAFCSELLSSVLHFVLQIVRERCDHRALNIRHITRKLTAHPSQVRHMLKSGTKAQQPWW